MSRLNTELHPSLSEEVLKLLFSKNIYTVINFVEYEISSLSKISTLTFKEIIDIRESITKKYGGKTYNGVDYYNILMNKVKIIQTHIKSLDELLDGGLVSDNVYEICGFAASGKTLLCLTICANISQFYKKNILYIDTKCDFSAEFIESILNERKLEKETKTEILNRIKIQRLFDRFELMNVLHGIKSSDTALIIIDSLPAIFYHLGDFSDTISFMNHFANAIRYISKELNIPLLLVNIMLKNSGGKVDKVALGRYWASVPNVRLCITKQNEFFRINAIKSLGIDPEKNCDIFMTNKGFE